jgi:hypothetical protein
MVHSDVNNPSEVAISSRFKLGSFGLKYIFAVSLPRKVTQDQGLA